jgi:hypothetical protein
LTFSQTVVVAVNKNNIGMELFYKDPSLGFA